MRITILNGNSDRENSFFETYLEDVHKHLESRKHSVSHRRLRELDIKPCRGCFGCWLKTPGLCVVPDDTDLLRRDIVQSDLVLLASPLKMGFISALLRRAVEKMIPLVLPHLKIVNGEFHHRVRYNHLPVMAGLVQEEGDTTAEDLDIMKNIFLRNALNLGTEFNGLLLTSSPLEVTVNALDRP
ncbi:MAG: flavodoxin family protein [Thermovirgaceae bacterium]